jgi:hypothetical protein
LNNICSCSNTSVIALELILPLPYSTLPHSYFPLGSGRRITITTAGGGGGGNNRHAARDGGGHGGPMRRETGRQRDQNPYRGDGGRRSGGGGGGGARPHRGHPRVPLIDNEDLNAELDAYMGDAAPVAGGAQEGGGAGGGGGGGGGGRKKGKLTPVITTTAELDAQLAAYTAAPATDIAK